MVAKSTTNNATQIRAERYLRLAVQQLPAAKKFRQLAQPSIGWSHYPERLKPEHAYSELGFKAWVAKIGQMRGPKNLKLLLELKYQRRAQSIVAQTQVLIDTPNFDILLNKKRLSRLVAKNGMSEKNIADTLALVGLAAYRSLKLKPFATQYMCALAMLDQRFAEMATGEGKTIAAGLVAAVAAIGGAPVHMLTANDYLAERDSNELEPFFAALGLSTQCALEAHKPEERQLAYRCNIVYATAKTVAFDYLRDRLKRSHYASDLERRMDTGEAALKSSGLMLPGLCFALIDEADSILIDEAKVPLIISDERKDPEERARLWQSLDLARQLEINTHFTIHRTGRFVKLTETGKNTLAELASQYGKSWLNRQHREELVTLGLSALYIMQCDKDYLVRDDKIHIIDQITGRIAEGRIWSRGLHGLIALKENITLPPNSETLASITFPRFFDRYHHLCGLSGTIKESSAELKFNYHSAMIAVPLRTKSRRIQEGVKVFKRHEELSKALVTRVKQLHQLGRPVLIATDSVEQSQDIRELLQKAKLIPEILNARHDAHEAVVIAKAGNPSAITVATQMAGRGTDIRLGEGVAKAGGLHVLNLQLNRSPRQDRQVRGRSARQGDPGSYEHWLSADSKSVQERAVCKLLAAAAARFAVFGPILLYFYQQNRESEDLKQREQVKRRDQQWAKQLSFAKIVE
jgi:preprotein translocase subunit SecA